MAGFLPYLKLADPSQIILEVLGTEVTNLSLTSPNPIVLGVVGDAVELLSLVSGGESVVLDIKY